MRKLLLALIASLITISPVYAFNLSFLDDSPVYYFTPADFAISQKTAMKALSSARDNEKVSWRNPQTGASGYYVPFNSTVQNGRKCRQLKIYSQAHQRTGLSTYQFCLINGEWKIPS